MIQTKVVKEHGEEFLMVFMQERWWYVAKQIANFLDYSQSDRALKLINLKHKLTLRKKGNEDIFKVILDAPSSEGDTSKTSQISFIDEDGLVVLAMNSDKPNAKLMVEKMISSFKMELDKAGLNALEALSRIEKDENIMVNARITKLLNEGVIKYTHCIVNKTINELVFYKYFPKCQFGQDINTEKLRTTFEVDSRLKDTDITHERHIVGNELLEMLDKFYLFNEEQMGLKQAKYLYVKKNNYDEEIVKMFKDRLQK